MGTASDGCWYSTFALFWGLMLLWTSQEEVDALHQTWLVISCLFWGWLSLAWGSGLCDFSSGRAFLWPLICFLSPLSGAQF